MRRAARTDQNHSEVVSAFRKMGCSVVSLAAIGSGCPDLLVAHRKGSGWANTLVEVKDGSKPPSGRSLTPDQVTFHAAWKGPIAIVQSIDDVLALLK